MMQVNDKRLKELLLKVKNSGDIDCPNNVQSDCKNTSKCFECWNEYLKENIW